MFTTRSELRPLVSIELGNLDIFSLKNAMIQGVEETVANAIDMIFSATDRGAKNAFLCFLGTSLADMDQHRLMDEDI